MVMVVRAVVAYGLASALATFFLAQFAKVGDFSPVSQINSVNDSLTPEKSD